MVGKKMVALVPPGEQVSFFIPVFVKVDGKSRPGGLLYTDKHVIVGYTEGAMRLSSSYARAISLAAITSSPMSKQKNRAVRSEIPFDHRSFARVLVRRDLQRVWNQQTDLRGGGQHIARLCNRGSRRRGRGQRPEHRHECAELHAERQRSQSHLSAWIVVDAGTARR